MKKAADVAAVKDAYAACQGRVAHRPRCAVGALDLAEKIAGHSFFGAQSRQSLARKEVDWPQLMRSIDALVDDGWLRKITADEARKVHVTSYGMTQNGHYWISQQGYDEAIAVKQRTERERLRSSLSQTAARIIRERHEAEYRAEYERMCAEHGIEPREGGEVLPSW